MMRKPLGFSILLALSLSGCVKQDPRVAGLEKKVAELAAVQTTMHAELKSEIALIRVADVSPVFDRADPAQYVAQGRAGNGRPNSGEVDVSAHCPSASTNSTRGRTGRRSS